MDLMHFENGISHSWDRDSGKARVRWAINCEWIEVWEMADLFLVAALFDWHSIIIECVSVNYMYWHEFIIGVSHLCNSQIQC